MALAPCRWASDAKAIESGARLAGAGVRDVDITRNAISVLFARPVHLTLGEMAVRSDNALAGKEMAVAACDHAGSASTRSCA